MNEEIILKLKIRKIGTSLGLILPKKQLLYNHIGEGDIVIARIQKDNNVIKE